MIRSKSAILLTGSCLVLGLLIATMLWVSHHAPRRVVTTAAPALSDPARESVASALTATSRVGFAAAAWRIPLATVMQWGGQSPFMDGSAVGTMAIPDDCFAEAAIDPQLASWLTNWRSAIEKGGRAMPQDRAALQDVLKGTKLTSLALVDIGRAVAFLSGDEPTAARIFAAAAYRGADEVNAVKSDRLRFRALLIGLTSTRNLLWRVISNGERELLPALQVLCETVALWDPSKDPVLDAAAEYSRIHLVECMYLQGRGAEALKAIAPLRQRKLTPDQELAVDWANGLALEQERRYPEATAMFTIVAAKADSSRAAEAKASIIRIMIQTGDLDQARINYEAFCRDGHLSGLSPALANYFAEKLAPPSQAVFAVSDQSGASVPPDVIDPQASVGKRLPFLDQIAARSALSKGKWLLVIYHHDCPMCQEALPRYQDRSKKGERIAFVEVPPLATPAQQPVRKDPAWIVTSLTADRMWFFPMLTRFEIADGVVKRTWSGDQAD